MLLFFVSAARTNKNRDIFVLFVSHVGYPRNRSEVSPVIQALETFPNIYFRNVYIPYLVAETPVEKWFNTGNLFTSKKKYFKEHVSDFLRFLLIYQFGGTYFDMDFIVQKNLDSLRPNFLGDEDGNQIGSAVVNFQHNGIGHEMASIILQLSYVLTF